MKPARIAVLLVAVGAAGLAALMMTGGQSPAPTAPAEVAQAPNVEVLVAGGEILRGQALQSETMRWQPWPTGLKPTGAIVREEQPDAVQQLGGSIALAGMMDGDVIRREKLIKADSNGFMSAILPAGMRAVAIVTDSKGTNSAGGFILPNDRVDVIRTFRDDEASRASGTDVQRSETVLSNIKVLAIGQTVQEKGGEKVVTGDTATLEVTSQQAEQLALSQKVGQLSLALRSLSDAAQLTAPAAERDSGLTVVRFGVTSRSASN